MAEVAFHFNVGNKLGYACRLLRKAWRNGRRCMVVVDAADLPTLDQALWTSGGDDFLPHARADASAALVKHSPILLGEQVAPQWPADVLVNLSAQVPAGLDGFERVIEVVSVDEADRQHARLRWRQYTDAGHSLVRHDLGAAGEP